MRFSTRTEGSLKKHWYKVCNILLQIFVFSLAPFLIPLPICPFPGIWTYLLTLFFSENRICTTQSLRKMRSAISSAFLILIQYHNRLKPGISADTYNVDWPMGDGKPLLSRSNLQTQRPGQSRLILPPPLLLQLLYLAVLHMMASGGSIMKVAKKSNNERKNVLPKTNSRTNPHQDLPACSMNMIL